MAACVGNFSKENLILVISKEYFVFQIYFLLTFVEVAADQEQNATEDTPSQTTKEQPNHVKSMS